MESIETIMEVLNITLEQATQVKGVITGTIDPMTYEKVTNWVKNCYNMPRKVELKLEALNEIIEGFGIEYIKHIDDTFTFPMGLSYVNLGDTYINTVIYDHNLDIFRFCSYGDIVEENMESYV